MRPLLALLCLMAAAPPGRASESLAAFEWRQHPGAPLPLDTVLRDETGHDVALRAVVGPAPTILDLGYFQCPSLCGVVRADLMQALRDGGLRAGTDYALVSLSIDPAETPAAAAAAKAADLARAGAGRGGMAAGGAWHYLTGSAAAIDAVAAAVGFRDRYDPRLRQFLHPSGLVLLTPSGRVGGYLLGVGYTGAALRAGLASAASGATAPPALPILLLCFHYDPATGRYTLAIMKVLRGMAVLTVLTLAGLFLVLNRYKPGGAA